MFVFFLFQAEDGIRDLVRSRGLGDVYKRQSHENPRLRGELENEQERPGSCGVGPRIRPADQRLSLIHI